MTPEDFKIMQKSVRKAKRIATEKAGEMHDLVEDRLPAAFEEIPQLAQETYDACLAWSKAEANLKEIESKLNKGYKE
ncbi:MAG: hypothetical protein KZQ64_14320 [gamma proteobacterium symbiont of Bathyaustriella thionipta]|nr:hypothetical protein [gamma proteobacterium symbiont of Bathyaustriella thionipta]MCU7950912.1 hypothetical protein [gamma proteobacterium symbiont of Bathyaustriella thionipta]MCU7954546.1 hypothetical protein [gamma proteobacterium symbiont of Bathyaustriella thionipta]MCU7957403.1 hypothetical protein [gamma proteobacterium symbiont of Bathyaustriella thionipta]MCU7968395.1 hypothetical protein [gamma proteobacterium symbiont of Bathyaustriella thionipta]